MNFALHSRSAPRQSGAATAASGYAVVATPLCRRAGTRATNRGSVLIIVLWISFGLVSIALYLANTMSMELRAADNRAAALAADQAIEGAVRYVSAVLSAYATNGVMPDLTQYAAEAVPIGDSHFWIIGRDPASPPTYPDRVYFSLVDEASKLNLNSASTNQLQYLPGMNQDLLSAILDWRNPNASGASQMNYAMASSPYTCKGAPFETVDELRLVYGTAMDILAGDDVNRNGILDTHEKDLEGNSQCDPGLFEYVTVYSRDPNFHSDGGMKTNVNSSSQLLPLLRERLGPARASQITVRLGPLPSPSLLAFYMRSGMTADEFAMIYNNVTISNSRYKRGRVNINTAPAAVLACLPGLDDSTAQQLVSYRQTTANLNSIAWIVEALGNNNTALAQLAAGDYITTQSYQFTADIAALGQHGRGYRRAKFIFDITEGTPKILYRQDLTRLGWALGETVRQEWVAKKTL